MISAGAGEGAVEKSAAETKLPEGGGVDGNGLSLFGMDAETMKNFVGTTTLGDFLGLEVGKMIGGAVGNLINWISQGIIEDRRLETMETINDRRADASETMTATVSDAQVSIERERTTAIKDTNRTETKLATINANRDIVVNRDNRASDERLRLAEGFDRTVNLPRDDYYYG